MVTYNYSNEEMMEYHIRHGEKIAYYIGWNIRCRCVSTAIYDQLDEFIRTYRANILSDNFSSIGVGLYKIGNKVYATQEFYK